jgi:hypothetical protein
MAQASSATTIHDAHDGHSVYSSGAACLRHAHTHGIPDLATALGAATALPS